MDPIRQREVADRTARLLPLVADRLQRLSSNVGEQLGLSAVQLQALEYVYRHGACSIATLTRALRRAQSSISELTARLEHKGFIHRVAAADDRRKSLVALTPRGRKWMAGQDGRHRVAVCRELSLLDARRQEELLVHLTEVLRLTDALRKGRGDSRRNILGRNRTEHPLRPTLQ